MNGYVWFFPPARIIFIPFLLLGNICSMALHGRQSYKVKECYVWVFLCSPLLEASPRYNSVSILYFSFSFATFCVLPRFAPTEMWSGRSVHRERWSKSQNYGLKHAVNVSFLFNMHYDVCGDDMVDLLTLLSHPWSVVNSSRCACNGIP